MKFAKKILLALKKLQIYLNSSLIEISNEKLSLLIMKFTDKHLLMFSE